MFEEFGINAGFVEDLHAQYRQSPHSVEEHWRLFFDEYDRGAGATNGGSLIQHVPTKEPYTNGNGNGNGNGGNGAALYAIAPAAPASSPGRDERLLAAAALQGRVYQLVNAYRVRGHLF